MTCGMYDSFEGEVTGDILRDREWERGMTYSNSGPDVQSTISHDLSHTYAQLIVCAVVFWINMPQNWSC